MTLRTRAFNCLRRDSLLPLRCLLARGLANQGTQTSLRSSPQPRKELGDVLADVIKTTGPISVAAYMRQCLTNPDSGYYINKDPFGVEGDFITSPEISQMFGELVAIWCVTEWMAQRRPEQIRLIELGPGRATLLRDMLKAFQSFVPFKSTIADICLVEASPTLRTAQHSNLCDSAMKETADGFSSITRYGLPIKWYSNLKEVPRDVTSFIIAHEFFDALPIHQFEHTQHGWREIMVDYSIPERKTPLSLPGQTRSFDEKPKFNLTVLPYYTPSSKVGPESSSRYKKLPVNSKIEISPESWDVAKDLALRISEQRTPESPTGSGAALVIDYGPAKTIPVDTLRAIKGHHFVSPFEEPGTADLSADVDFTALKSVAEREGHVAVHGPVEQGDWLHALGIGARATVLANQQTTPEGKDRVAKEYHRLVERSGGAMGKIYKVMALTPDETPTPVGFGGGVVEDGQGIE
ncbi:S-adenosyl-L-methionine-dependent methyltransferase [Lipomyces tetrasporus]